VEPRSRDTAIDEPVQRKRDQILRNVEEKVNLGLERQINSIIGYVRFILNTEQKRSDFRPEDESRDITVIHTIINFHAWLLLILSSH